LPFSKAGIAGDTKSRSAHFYEWLWSILPIPINFRRLIMTTNGFGDLREWVMVLDKIEKLHDTSSLDTSQDELVRVLNFRENWRLTERALEYAGSISQPKNELITAICTVMCDDDAFMDNRILAAAALGVLVPKKFRQTPEKPHFNGTAVEDIMQRLLDVPQAPIFHAALSQALQSMK
jgi:hypothetical protein